MIGPIDVADSFLQPRQFDDVYWRLYIRSPELISSVVIIEMFVEPTNVYLHEASECGN